jgi:predicted metal-dependent hydrolase
VFAGRAAFAESAAPNTPSAPWPLPNSALLSTVHRKEDKIRRLIEGLEGSAMDPRYLGFFRCFNSQLFFEAHDVLEDLWLEDRHGPAGNFYKGLIQLAGAFVHIQKGRPGPASALFNLARNNLSLYPPLYQNLDLSITLKLIRSWTERVGAEGGTALDREQPALKLESVDLTPRSASAPDSQSPL